MFEASDIKEEWFVQAILLAHGGSCFFDRSGKKAIMLDAIVNDPQLMTVDFEELLDIASGILADRDDFRLPAGEMLNDNTAIKHAGEVVFSGDAKGSKVMNGGNQWTGLAPHQ